MQTDSTHGRREATHLAECAAQVMAAVAAGRAHHGHEKFDLAHALEAIADLHECHTFAAIIVMAQMLNEMECGNPWWLNEIPRFVATIASVTVE